MPLDTKPRAERDNSFVFEADPKGEITNRVKTGGVDIT
jgi:hypothetical protein